MIFVGDISVPSGMDKIDVEKLDIFKSPVIANFEGGIPEEPNALLSQKKLFNDKEAIKFLEKLNVKVVTLANNHVTDINLSPFASIEFLQANKILVCGAGNNLDEAATPCFLKVNNKEYVFLAFGWEVIQCKAATASRPGVNPLRPKHVINSIKRAKTEKPDAVIVVLMHWDYELELYPQPMHRQLAFRAVDAGADAIIGCHSHCVQGVEVYKGAPIVYSLGNWFIPHNIYFNNRLKFPDIALKELAFEWDFESNKMICHWFNYCAETHAIKYLNSESLHMSDAIKELTPFSEMDLNEYIGWFGKNRRKNKLLPIYKSCDTLIANWFKDKWVEYRQLLITIAFALKLKHAPK